MQMQTPQMKNNISALSGFLQCAESPVPPSGAACAPLARSRSSPPAPIQQQQEQTPSTSDNHDVNVVATAALPALPDLVQGSKMRININNCPSELRRFTASPYVVIQKYNKAYYLKKQYWAKIYEVQYALIKNPLSAAPRSDIEEHVVPATSRKSFVAATGDEIGLFGEGSTPDDAAVDLQIKLCRSILQLLEEGQSHCLPSKRKHQNVLLKDFEEEMVSHGVKILSPPKYVPIKITFDIPALKKPSKPTTPAGLNVDGAQTAAAAIAPVTNGAAASDSAAPATYITDQQPNVSQQSGARAPAPQPRPSPSTPPAVALPIPPAALAPASQPPSQEPQPGPPAATLVQQAAPIDQAPAVPTGDYAASPISLNPTPTPPT
ncbi:hypothetical protein GOP47_0005853 [Adiantum capillus-veneris]|uniref:Uncharacterized protein n=1 Tax=Adiantum capillus-veneris TaxID=13818 RepID=A0A9D4V6C3_ADICA|nr:hypothetical protein GOP47_0005853 [Adiantum capillus-veneris]